MYINLITQSDKGLMFYFYSVLQVRRRKMRVLLDSGKAIPLLQLFTEVHGFLYIVMDFV